MPTPQPARLSRAETAELILPSDTNVHGTAFGGRVVQWMDLCSSMAAGRHCRQPVVTVSIDDLHFHGPMRLGEFALLSARVTAAFRTSMEVECTVMAENPTSGEKRLCTSAFLTFVALDAKSRPLEVPPLLLETDEERRNFAEAGERRAARLARAKRQA
jgi:acyl-CoA hydrolase